MEIEPEDITASLLRDLELLEPFGQGNPRPFFKMKNFTVDSYQIVGQSHVRWKLVPLRQRGRKFSLPGISFNYLDKWKLPHPKEIFAVKDDKTVSPTAYFTLGINRFRGNEFIQLMIHRVTL